MATVTVEQDIQQLRTTYISCSCVLENRKLNINGWKSQKLVQIWNERDLNSQVCYAENKTA